MKIPKDYSDFTDKLPLRSRLMMVFLQVVFPKTVANLQEEAIRVSLKLAFKQGESGEKE